MSIRNAIPTIWAAGFLVALRKALVYGDVINTDYEGEIASQGDSVKILTIGRPTVRKYLPNVTEIVPDPITAAEQFLNVTEADYFAVEIDDVDRRQAVPGLMEQAADEGAYAMSDETDRFIAAKYTEVAAANRLGIRAITTPALAGQALTDLMVKLDAANVGREGRFVIVPPWYHGLLTGVPEFIPADTANMVLNGRVGRLKGFDIRMSNNVPNPAGDDWEVMAGVRSALSFATQIPVDTIHFYRPESSFSDAMKALHLYGAKVVRPDCLATVTASIT